MEIHSIPTLFLIFGPLIFQSKQQIWNLVVTIYIQNKKQIHALPKTSSFSFKENSFMFFQPIMLRLSKHSKNSHASMEKVDKKSLEKNKRHK